MKAQSYFDKGVTFYTQKKYEDSVKMFSKAIELKSNYIEAYNNKGLALDQLKKHKEALQMYDKALEINPNSASSYNNKGSIYHAIRNYEEAIKCYDKALEIDPNYNDPKINREASKFYMRVTKIALIIFEGHFKLQENQAQYLKGKTLEEQIKFTEAMILYEKSLQLRVQYPLQFLNDNNSKDNSFEIIEAKVLLRELERLKKEDKKLKKQKKVKEKALKMEYDKFDIGNPNSENVENKVEINQFKEKLVSDNNIIQNYAEQNSEGVNNNEENDKKCDTISKHGDEKSKKNEIKHNINNYLGNNLKAKKDEMTLDEMLDYIMVENVNKKNKKSKKKKKNKNFESLESQKISETPKQNVIERQEKDQISDLETKLNSLEINDRDDEASILIFDDFVENFKKSLNQNSKHAETSIKIKPIFTKDWLESLIY